MGKMRKAKKFAAKKRILNPKDTRIKKNQEKAKEKESKIIKSLKDRVSEDIQVKEV
jgi:hypothetical protein